MVYLNITFFSITFFLTGLMIYSSIDEKNLRATLISSLIFIINMAMWTILIKLDNNPQITILNYFVLTVIFVFTLISIIKKESKAYKINESEIVQFDERDHMFSRNRLKYNENNAKKYYSQFPEKEKIDKLIAEKPGLLTENSTYYDKFYSKAADSVFNVVSKTHNLIEGETNIEQQSYEKKELFKTIYDLGKYYGAVDIGVTKLKKHHIYSKHGRHENQWGEEVNLKHKFAIAIIVKMDIKMVENAPATPAILESSKQYLEAAKIAYVLSEFIRSLGYDAKAHVDGKYDVICAPIAEDAKLGKVSRMGIFMHKEYGPSVRISVITTDLDILVENNENYQYMDDFCEICKKCADNCPTGSILKGKKEKSRGFYHWSIDQEKCFTFWNSAGTDCAFCIKVCPFTKPNTLLHKLARWYISRNPINRRIALFADDLLYGRKFKICKCNPEKMIHTEK